MNTLPDGVPPTMQMYLFHFPGTTAAQEPYVPSSSDFSADVLYHEYTHGLSNRLVVDASGNGALNAIQARSLGEAWSDYYANGLPGHQGFVHDTNADGQVREGAYLTHGPGIRTEAIDCRVHSQADHCVDVFGGHGGYTYDDFPFINGAFPEVHASGEVCAQTLWDLRTEFGHAKAAMLITRGMELSPTEPSMLDMRNAILQADKVAFGGSDQPEIWRVFAHRGMGWFAGSIDGADAFPAQDFHTPPPATSQRATLTGTVTDPITGEPVAGGLVAITRHDSGFLGDYTDVTDAQGHYAINFVLPGRYKKVVVNAPGYEIASRAVNVQPPSTTRNFQVRFDWAASVNGGQITAFNGPDYSEFGCGPDKAIDLTQANGWGSTTGNNAGDPTNVFIPKFIVVHLPQTINIASFAVDPTATCGDSPSASTGDFRIETSPNGTAWTTAATGTFDSTDRFHYNEVTPTGGTTGVNFVRFTILGNQVPDFATNCPDGNFSGCSFTDMTELEVFGS